MHAMPEGTAPWQSTGAAGAQEPTAGCEPGATKTGRGARLPVAGLHVCVPSALGGTPKQRIARTRPTDVTPTSGGNDALSSMMAVLAGSPSDPVVLVRNSWTRRATGFEASLGTMPNEIGHRSLLEASRRRRWGAALPSSM